PFSSQREISSMILTISIWFDVTKCNFNLNLSVFRHLDELRTNLSLFCMSSTQLLLDTILPEHSSSQEWNREALEFLDSFLNSENTTSLLETTVATPEDSSVGLAETIAELSNDSRILDGKIVSTLSTETNLSLLVNSCNVFNDSVAKFSSLLESTRKQVELIEEHSTISTVNLKKLSIPQTQNIAPLLYNFSDMVLLLEIPALTKLLIAKSQFADCIQLSSISKNLQIRYHKLPLVNSIQENTSLQISDMVKKLSGLLLSNIKQSSMIKILSHLKKVIPDNDHLKSIFLHLRFAFIMDELDTLTPLLNSRLYEKYLKRPGTPAKVEDMSSYVPTINIDLKKSAQNAAAKEQAGKPESETLNVNDDNASVRSNGSSTSSYIHDNEFIAPKDYSMSFPWKKIGAFIEDSSNLTPEELHEFSSDDSDNKLVTYIYEKYYADLYWNMALVVGCCFASWMFSYYGFGLLSFLFVSLFTFAAYRTEFRRFNTNIRDDMQRIQSKENLEKKLESMDWLNSFLAKFWVIYMPALSDLVISNTNLILKDVQPPPPIIKLSLDEFTLGTKAPKIDSIRSFTKLGKDLYQMDWKFNFTPNDISDMTQNELKNKIDPKISLGIRIGKGLVSASLPVLVENMSFVGNMRIKIKLGDIFPHIDVVSICFLEPPSIDYALKPVGGNTLGIDVMSVIPGLSSFVKSLINSNLAPIMYYPNTIDSNFELQDLLQDSVLEMNVEKLTKNNKNVGKIVYDLKWYPVIDIVNSEAAESSEIGIINLNILSALGLDTSSSMIGKLSTFVEVYIDDLLIEKSRIVKGNNQPEYNFQFEDLIYHRSTSVLKILIKDISSFNETVIAEYQSKVLDVTLINSENIDEVNQNQVVKPFTKGKGKLNFSALWKPLGSISENDDDAENDVSFTPPIGIFKIDIDSCENLDKMDSLSNMNPFIQIISGGKVKARTEAIDRTLNPVFKEDFYISVLSKNQKIRLNCMDAEPKGKEDRLIGQLILNTRSFFDDPDFHNKEVSISKELLRNGKVTGKINFKLHFYPLMEVFSHNEIKQIQMLQQEESEKSEDLDELEEQARFLEDYKKHPDDYEWVDDDDNGAKQILEANKNKVIMPLDEVVKYNSGVLGINVLSGTLHEKHCFVQFFIDDHSYPDFTTRGSRHGRISSCSGECFIRDLKHSILNIRITKRENPKYRDDIIYETVDSFNVLELLKSGFDESVELDLNGNKLDIIFEFVPAITDDALNVFESVEDTGLLTVGLLRANGLLSADRNGYSDPYVEGYINQKHLFKSKTIKKTLNPEWNEVFKVPIKSKTRQSLTLFVWDWDLAGDNDPLGNVTIPLKNLPANEDVFQSFKLNTQGAVELRLNFQPGYLKPNSISLLTSVKNDDGQNIPGLQSVNNLVSTTGAIGKMGTDAVGGLAGSGLNKLKSVSNIRNGGSTSSSNGDAETVNSRKGFTPHLPHLRAPFSHKKKPSYEYQDPRMSKDFASSVRKSQEFPAGDVNNTPPQLRIPSSPGNIDNGNYLKGRTSMDVVSVNTAAFQGSAAIAGRLTILDFESKRLSKVNYSVKVMIRSNNGSEKNVYKTKKMKCEGDAVKWHENAIFKCVPSTTMIFQLRENHAFGKTEELAQGEILLEQVAGVKDDIRITLRGKVEGYLNVNFNYA
ncbi:Tricalbin-3, partial [Pichia kudriavzevii]